MSTPAATTPTSASTTENLVIWADGRLVAPGEVALSAVDHGVTVGDGVFETCAVFNGRAFALTRHLRRLARSAAGLGLDAPDERRVLDGVEAVLAEADARTRAGAGPVGRLRITVTAGVGPLGSGRTPGEQTVVVAVGPAVIRPAGRAVRSPWTRNERSAVAGLKTTSYAENVVASPTPWPRAATRRSSRTRPATCARAPGRTLRRARGRARHPAPVLGLPRGHHARAAARVGGGGRSARARGASRRAPVRRARRGDRGESALLLTGSVRNVQPVTWLDGADVAVGELSVAARDLFERRRRERLDP